MAYYYLSKGIYDDAIKVGDVGITICTYEYPLRLINYLKKENYQITHPYAGIYYIHKEGIPDTQIVVNEPITLEKKYKSYLPTTSAKVFYIPS